MLMFRLVSALLLASLVFPAPAIAYDSTLESAVRHGFVSDVAEILRDQASIDFDTPEFDSSEVGFPSDGAPLLLSALHYYRDAKLEEYSTDESSYLEISEMLLKAGANPNGRAKSVEISMMTPLIYAVYNNLTPFVPLLVKHKADVNLFDAEKKTALNYLLESEVLNKDFATFSYLIKGGATIEKGRLVNVISWAEARNANPLILKVLRSSNWKAAVATAEQEHAKAEKSRKANEAAVKLANEKKHKEWLANLAKKGPIAILDKTLDENSIGTPEATLRILNVWKKTIDAFEVELRMQDNFGRALHEYGWGDANYIGISQDTIVPGAETSLTWTLHGFRNATKYTAKIIKVHFTDGSIWPNSKPRSRKRNK